MAKSAWNILDVWSDSGMNGVAVEVTAERDGEKVYVSAGTTEFGYHYVASGKSLFGGENASDSIIAEYSTQKEALASEYAPLFRRAIATYRKV